MISCLVAVNAMIYPSVNQCRCCKNDGPDEMKSYTSGQPPLGKYVLAADGRTIVVDVGRGIFKTSTDFYPIEVAYMAGGKFYGPMGKDERVGS
jgi:hypothetical protein